MKKTGIKGIFLRELSALSLKNFAMLTLAGTINSFGVVLFLFPVKLYDSGVSGLSMLLDQITPSYLTLSVFLVIINIPIFLFGSQTVDFAAEGISLYHPAGSIRYH